MNNESLHNEVDQVARELAAAIPVTVNPAAWEKMEQLLEETQMTKKDDARFRWGLSLWLLLLTTMSVVTVFLFFPNALVLKHNSPQPRLEQFQVTDTAQELTERPLYHRSNQQQSLPAQPPNQPKIVPEQPRQAVDSLHITPPVQDSGVFIFW